MRAFHLSPFYLLLIIASSIFVIEALVMYYVIAPHSPGDALLDSTVLTVAAFPVFYFFLFRPLVLHIRERVRAEEKLKEYQRHLEEMVEERTAELKREIEEHKGTEGDLRESEEKFVKISSSAQDAIALIDNDGKISYWNPAAERIFGYRAGEMLGRKLHDLIVPAGYRQAFREGFERFRETGEGPVVGKTIEISALKKDGTEFPVELSISAVKVKGRWGSVGVIRDATERKRSEERVRSMAYHDTLTGLPNRLLLLDRMNQALAGARREKRLAAVLFFDLDRFKHINDSLGHEAGDRLLTEVAGRLKGCVRGTDTVSRLGGDEFAVIVQDIERVENVTAVAEKVLSVLKEPFHIEGQELFVTASVGISIYPADGSDAETLLKNADISMYRAKEGGGGSYQLFAPEMNERAVRRLALETRLRRALEREEFLLHYQPEVDINTGEVVGIEALLRWRDPERGAVVLPGEFISLAGDTGLIVPIGEWVLGAACAQNRLWQERGLEPAIVAVNISPRQLRERNFLDMVDRTLRETGLDAKYLELELSESILTDGVADALRVLHTLRAMGIRLTIDDFGTGYSSLAYLRKMPIDMIKISRTFIRDITTDRGDLAITTAIIRAGHSLNVEAMAEGVETVEQLELLRRMQCDKVQGVLISRPLPAEEAGRFLEKGWRFLMQPEG